MTNKQNDVADVAVGSWAKRCYFAGRSMMEALLRPHGLGATQWYVMHQLANAGPTMQRDLLRTLQVERATLSVIVATLVRKGLIEQVADPDDQRKKQLRMTEAGAELWAELPDLGTSITEAAFGGIDEADLATAVRVLRAATERLDGLAKKGTNT